MAGMALALVLFTQWRLECLFLPGRPFAPCGFDAVGFTLASADVV